MKRFFKMAAALLMTSAMILSATAADTLLIAAPTAEAETAPVWVKLPKSLKFRSVVIENEPEDIAGLFDHDANTTYTFEDGMTITASSDIKFRLANVLVNKIDTKATYTISASADGETWKELNVKVLDKDNGFLEIDVIALPRAYKFYKVTATAEEALTFHTVAFTQEAFDMPYTPIELLDTIARVTPSVPVVETEAVVEVAE